MRQLRSEQRPVAAGRCVTASLEQQQWAEKLRRLLVCCERCNKTLVAPEQRQGVRLSWQSKRAAGR
ncbi:MAG: hypothetical protein KME03_18895 [Aphanocapsa lilacina HA4352-LM1]|nr:hypothetical protein [Aphanocapsa lilacina HA4352-LM1]